MRIGHLTVAITLAGGVALAACGGSGGSSAPAASTATTTVVATTVPATSTTLAPTTIAATTTTTLRELTEREVAAIVAKKAASLREGAAVVDECAFDFENCEIVGQLQSITFALEVLNLSNSLQLAEKEARMPASLVALVKDTKSIAAEVKLFVGEDPTKTMSCGPGSIATPEQQDECQSLYMLVAGAARGLVEVLDGWKVYGTES